jgi:ABC-type multidrug transport system, ATPase component
MTDSVVSVRGFTKRYGSAVAVEHLGFELGRGEIFALLGPNGAGKTSSLECIEGLRRASEGKIEVLGLDPIRDSHRLMRRVGIQLQAQGLPAAMSVADALGFFARYRGLEPSTEAASRLGLEAKLKSQVSSLSTGQQRRLALALAIQGAPELVVLDEPTAGLDVETRDELHAIMAELKKEGAAILLASHDMAEVEKLADRALVLVQGRVAAQGSPRELTSQGEGRTRITASTSRGELIRLMPDFPEAQRLPPAEGYAHYLTTKPGTSLAALLAWLEARGDEILDLRVERPSLEERFLEIVQRRAA